MSNRMAKLTEEISEPKSLLSGGSRSVELRLAGGESDGGGASAPPANQARAKGKAIALGGAPIRDDVSPGGVTEADEGGSGNTTKGEGVL